jgi:hypothetical protein
MIVLCDFTSNLRVYPVSGMQRRVQDKFLLMSGFEVILKIAEGEQLKLTSSSAVLCDSRTLNAGSGRTALCCRDALVQGFFFFRRMCLVKKKFVLLWA